MMIHWLKIPIVYQWSTVDSSDHWWFSGPMVIQYKPTVIRGAKRASVDSQCMNVLWLFNVSVVAVWMNGDLEVWPVTQRIGVTFLSQWWVCRPTLDQRGLYKPVSQLSFDTSVNHWLLGRWMMTRRTEGPQRLSEPKAVPLISGNSVD